MLQAVLCLQLAPFNRGRTHYCWADPLLLGSELHACSYAVESLNDPLEGCQEGGTLRQGTVSPLLPQAVFWLLSL